MVRQPHHQRDGCRHQRPAAAPMCRWNVQARCYARRDLTRPTG